MNVILEVQLLVSGRRHHDCLLLLLLSRLQSDVVRDSNFNLLSRCGCLNLGRRLDLGWCLNLHWLLNFLDWLGLHRFLDHDLFGFLDQLFRCLFLFNHFLQSHRRLLNRFSLFIVLLAPVFEILANSVEVLELELRQRLVLLLHRWQLATITEDLGS